MRFQNWRSLKDVTIDNLTPITVFIGANSSGKTNILDALHFRRDVETFGGIETAFQWQRRNQFNTLGTQETVTLEISYKTSATKYSNSEFHIDPIESSLLEKYGASQKNGNHRTEKASGNDLFRSRWQLLDENFAPTLIRTGVNTSNLYRIDRHADNLIDILDFMRLTQSALYQRFLDDVSFLLSHVADIRIERSEHESRLHIREKRYPDVDAPTISSGTARVLAMLAAYYVLDMRDAELPGLVVIEEPDTALNPGLLERFVEQLRNYTEGEHPRQFILTTHNPYFLNYFEPEEVRVVERGEDGYTTVKAFDPKIAARWLEKDFALGDIWTSRVVGGVPS
jgi:predicted ATPase